MYGPGTQLWSTKSTLRPKSKKTKKTNLTSKSSKWSSNLNCRKQGSNRRSSGGKGSWKNPTSSWSCRKLTYHTGTNQTFSTSSNVIRNSCTGTKTLMKSTTLPKRSSKSSTSFSLRGLDRTKLVLSWKSITDSNYSWVTLSGVFWLKRRLSKTLGKTSCRSWHMMPTDLQSLSRSKGTTFYFSWSLLWLSNCRLPCSNQR